MGATSSYGRADPLATSKYFAHSPDYPFMYVEHLRIPIGSGALHVERVGRGGPPVVLLHGFGTCAFLWRRLSPALAMAGYTAIAIDLLGHGCTTGISASDR